MMKHFILILVILLSPYTAAAQQQTTGNDSINHIIQLQEIVVKGNNLVLEDDHIICIPTESQRKHAHSGFDLLYRMMIPNVSVDYQKGEVVTPAGHAALYINGRKATYREIESLRPKEVVKIEYFDSPTGKYSIDASSVNFVLKDLKSGGYTLLDGKQDIGYLVGDYNLVSKYSFNNFNVNVWTGYKASDLNIDEEETEKYINSRTGNIIKDSRYSQNNRLGNLYGIASISKIDKKQMWMVRTGVERQTTDNDVDEGFISYTSTYPSASFTKKESERFIKPTTYLYYSRDISDSRHVDVVLDGYYSKRKYERSYHESDNTFLSNASESYLYTKINANYSISMKNKSSMTFSVHEYFRNSHIAYDITSGNSKQHLYSSETIFFADYSKRISGNILLNIHPGLSYMTYRLSGSPSINHLTPRLNLMGAYMISKKKRLQLSLALGNTYPSPNTINNARQRIDRIMIRCGNPEMDNSILLMPRLSYHWSLDNLSFSTNLQYYYMNHAIANVYLYDGDYLINTFSSDNRYQRTSLDLSAVYKPSSLLNVKLGGGYSHTDLAGVVNKGVHTLWGNLQVDLSIKDLYVSFMMNTSHRQIVNNQITQKIPWNYSVTIGWDYKMLSLKVNMDNLFFTHQGINNFATSDIYSFSYSTNNQAYNQSASIKVAYTFEYGKKVTRSYIYNSIGSESAILRGKL